MPIKCANCMEYHEDIDGVRACYGLGPAARPTFAAASEPVVTEKQAAYIDTLRHERGLDEFTGTLTKREASLEIERLLKWMKTKPNTNMVAGVDTSGIKDGRYAVEIGGTLKFYKVDKPTEGRWSGYTFVKVQASDDLWPVRGAAATAVLAAIAKDPQAAMLRYGREIGRCGHCNRTLTNEESRRLGIGPICRRGMGDWMNVLGSFAEDDLVPESDSPIR